MENFNYSKQVAPNVPLNSSTMVISRVSRLPYIGEPHQKPLKSYEVKIAAVPIPEPKPDIVPLWIIILSAVVGVIILLLLIYLLYKVSFKVFCTMSTNSKNKIHLIFYLHFFKINLFQFLQIVWFLQASSTGSFTGTSTTTERLSW